MCVFNIIEDKITQHQKNYIITNLNFIGLKLITALYSTLVQTD